MADAAAGRRLVLMVIIVTLAIGVLVGIGGSWALGGGRFSRQLVSLVFTAGLSFFLYLGANWARLFAGAGFGIAGLAGLAGMLLAMPRAGALLIGVLGAVYLASAYILLFVPSVRAHFGVARPVVPSLRDERIR